jgi:hypothetical protein
MEFISYISKSKVDMLYNQLPESILNDVNFEKLKETSFDVGMDATLGFKQWLPSIVGKSSFGRKGRITYDAKLKKEYEYKLHIILLRLSEENQVIDADRCSVSKFKEAEFVFFFGEFFSKNFDESTTNYDYTSGLIKPYTTLYSNIVIDNIPYNLSLSCSMSYFAETIGDKHILTSSNIPFFRDGIKVKFRTVFKLLSIENDTVFGSPIFLSQSNSCKYDL